MFAPYSVIADIRTAAQCAAIDIDRDITTGEFCNDTSDCATMSKTLTAMRIVDDGRPEQTLGQVNEMGKYFTDKTTLILDNILYIERC